MKGIKGFTEGNSGRPKGAVGKVTADVRDKFRKLIEMFTAEQMYEDLMFMEPKDRMNAICGISEYLVPKLARMELQADINVKTVTETTLFQIKPKG